MSTYPQFSKGTWSNGLVPAYIGLTPSFDVLAMKGKEVYDESVSKMTEAYLNGPVASLDAVSSH